MEELAAAPAERARLLNTLSAVMPCAAIVGVPGPGRAPRSLPLLELLATTDVPEWAFVVHARPVAREQLFRRYGEISALRQRVADAGNTTRQVTATSSRTEQDVRRKLLGDLLEREEDRTLGAARRSGFATEAWLLAADPGALAALSAIVASGVASPPGRPLPAEVVVFSPSGASAETLLTDGDVAALIAPPVHDVPGLAVRSWARFDEVPEAIGVGGRMIDLGQTPAGVPVRYPVDALTAHTLVTGLTGSGKTTFVAALRAQAKVPTLVIEPTKNDFAAAAAAGAVVWRIGDPGDVSGLALNPLEVPPGTPVQTHIDRLIALFESSFTLFSPLPEVLELGLHRAYVARGWHLATDRNAIGELDPSYPIHPTLVDLLAACHEILDEMGYAHDVRDNVDAALRARLGSLVEGTKGRALQTTARFPIDRILAGDTIVNLDKVGSDEEKAFFIGLVLIRLLSARSGRHSTSLRHLTILEEAHRILKRETATDADGRSGPSFASELFGNLMAEIRSAGEGLVVIDQSPRKLTDDALANTALQVAFRTKLAADKEALTGAMNLSEPQAKALTGLERHRAIVFWEGMDRPLLVNTVRVFPARAVAAGAERSERARGPAARRPPAAPARRGPRPRQGRRAPSGVGADARSRPRTAPRERPQPRRRGDLRRGRRRDRAPRSRSPLAARAPDRRRPRRVARRPPPLPRLPRGLPPRRLPRRRTRRPDRRASARRRSGG